MPRNNKNNNKKKRKSKKNRWIKFKPIDPNKLIVAAVAWLCLSGVSVITDMRDDCRDAGQQIEQARQENPGTEIRYVGIGGVVCPIINPGSGGGSSGGWGP